MALLTPVRNLGDFGLLMAEVFKAAFREPPSLRSVFAEAYRIGIRSLPILLVISFFVGTNLAIQGYAAFLPFGGQRLLGMFVALAGVRELAPLMVAAMVAAKAGTEMASQIGVMKIREQVDALSVMAVDPLAYLVIPRMAGILLVLPALTTLSIATLVASAWMVTVYQLGEPGGSFLQLAAETTTLKDLMICNLKAAVFGTIISTISCWCGFQTTGGARGVGVSTNRAVVLSAVGCAVVNYLVSQGAYG